MTDDLAERVRKIGATIIRSIRHIAREQIAIEEYIGRYQLVS
jgi:DNA-binding ferritin-like protein